MYFFGKKMHQPVQNCCPIVAIERILSANAVDDAEMVRLTRHPNELWAKKYPIILRQIFLLILSGSVFYPHHQDYETFLSREIST